MESLACISGADQPLGCYLPTLASRARAGCSGDADEAGGTCLRQQCGDSRACSVIGRCAHQRIDEGSSRSEARSRDGGEAALQGVQPGGMVVGVRKELPWDRPVIEPTGGVLRIVAVVDTVAECGGVCSRCILICVGTAVECHMGTSCTFEGRLRQVAEPARPTVREPKDWGRDA